MIENNVPDRHLVINEKVNYLLKNHELVRNYHALTRRQNKVVFGSLRDLVKVLDIFLIKKGKIFLNGWEIKPVYYLEEDCWMNSEKIYEVHFYQIKDNQGGMIFPNNLYELLQLSDFLKQFL